MDVKSTFGQRIALTSKNFQQECSEDVPGIVGARTYAKEILNNLSRFSNSKSVHKTDWALIATGGFGRGDLSFASDIDILFVYRKRLDPYLKDFIETLVPLLWDLGFEVGHLVSSFTGLKKLISQDFSIQTSCLMNRFIAGDKELYKQVVQLGQPQRGKRFKKDFLEKTIRYRQERLKFYGESIYLL